MKAIYDASDNSLRELSQIEEPVKPNREDYGTEDQGYNSDFYHFECNHAIWREHIASLRKLPCSPEAGFKDKEVYEEGKDYEVMQPEIDIHAPAGTKMKVLFQDGSPLNGYDHEKIKVAKHLNPEQIYELETSVIYGWHTDFFVKEVPGIAFNSVHFIHPELIAVSLHPPQEPDPYPELLSKIATLFSEGKGNEEIVQVLREEWVISKK